MSQSDEKPNKKVGPQSKWRVCMTWTKGCEAQLTTVTPHQRMLLSYLALRLGQPLLPAKPDEIDSLPPGSETAC